jgi:iron complex outermembrane receptor protein
MLLIPFFSYSQIKINGKVINDNEPIPFANVILYDLSNKIVNGVVTDVDGLFELNAQAGTYKLIISNTSYETVEKEIILDKDLAFGYIVLIENKKVLNEVVVSGSKQRIVRKIDRIVFNIEISPIADTGNAFGALKVSLGLVLKNDDMPCLEKMG